MSTIDSADWAGLTEATDSLLLAMISPRPSLDRTTLRRLPPWRAVVIARIAHRCGLMGRRELDELVREARVYGELKPHVEKT